MAGSACLVHATDELPLEAGLVGWRFLGKAQTELSLPETWQLQDDGRLTCTGEPTGFLVSPREYENFVLELQWRWPEGTTAGNSGVLVSTIPAMEGFEIWPNSIEIQLAFGNAGEIYTLGRRTSFRTEGKVWKPMGIPVVHVDTHASAGTSFEKPAGQWNALKLIFVEGVLSVHINGVEVNRLMDVRPSRGKVALQSEGGAIEFREIRLRAAASQTDNSASD
ncbi:MAG: DUF1080 domain-containing protein [Opitutales bacterium]